VANPSFATALKKGLWMTVTKNPAIQGEGDECKGLENGIRINEKGLPAHLSVKS